MSKKLHAYVLYAILAIAPISTIAARGGGGGFHGGGGGGEFHGGGGEFHDGGGFRDGGLDGYPDQFNDRRYVDPNSYWNDGGGDYDDGGVIDNGAVIIDPDAGSGAGMSDDSDQLYQSYLNNFGTSQ